jgi:uncharacterized membrane protein HdeD (DUF308 family)
VEARGRRARVLLGAAAVAVGAYLIADPFDSLPVLAGLVAAALLLGASTELAERGGRRPRRSAAAAAAAGVVTGLLAAAWPGLTLRALAVVAGVGLLVAGAARLIGAGARDQEERLVLALSGAAACIAGLLALAWPGVTVLALSLAVGLASIAYGVAAMLGAGAERAEREDAPAGRHGRTLRRVAAAAALALALAGAGVSIALHESVTVHPGPFYAAPAPLPPGPHGTLIRWQPIPGFYQGAKAYRVLYKSIGFDGRPAAVSGVVVVPEGAPPRGGRRIVAFAHATVGTARSCAPSLRIGEAAQAFEGLGSFVAAGDVVAATDYSGLGTPGPHPYLIGRVAAMDVLDSVRAARRLPDVDAGLSFAVWGHSQGGQASLFAGQMAPAYTPELRLAGVAAGAPMPDLVALFKGAAASTAGRVLVGLALGAWSQLYPGASLARLLTPAGAADVAAIGGYCLYGNQYLAAAPPALAVGAQLRGRPPWELEPWRSIMRANSPGGAPVGAPVLITQGGADKIVRAATTVALVHRMCAQGDNVELRVYPSVEHAEAGIVASSDVAAWIAQRFAGSPAVSGCG